MPTGKYGGVRGWGREVPAYSILYRNRAFRISSKANFITSVSGAEEKMDRSTPALLTASVADECPVPRANQSTQSPMSPPSIPLSHFEGHCLQVKFILNPKFDLIQ
jgi:hypothetical protein